MMMRIKSKNETPKKPSVLTEIFKDYCSHASLHGIGYLGAKDKSLIEKVWWILVFLISLMFCMYLISRIWMKWENSPVIVSFAQGQTPLWEIPFPAVTICPLNKIRNNIYNYTKYFNKRKTLTGEEKKFFWDVSLVCNLDYFDIYDKYGDETTDEEAIDSILKVASKDFIAAITWQYKYANNTDEYFTPQITEEGLCFTSNSFSQKDMFTDKINHDVPFINHNRTNCGWDIEKGYPKGLRLDVYPRRTAQDGYISGLSVTLKTSLKEMDYVCGIPVYGYKLSLHNAAELPRTAQKYIMIPLDRQVTIAVQPELLTTSTGLLKIHPNIRNCYFSHEKSLKFFKIYTQNNCKIECLANMTKSYCGCVPFYLPRDNATLICGFSKLDCDEEVREALQHIEMMLREGSIPEEFKKLPEYDIYVKCNCLPACSSLHYRAETSQATGHYMKTILATENPIDTINTEEVRKGEMLLTQVDIFFKENHIIAVERSELFGQTDFLANCGGLLGLFLGFSILSIIEIVYFLTIRVFFKLRHTKKEAKVICDD